MKMAFDDLKLKISMFLDEMENKPADSLELLEQVHLELNQLKATGQPLPADLVELEKRLELAFTVKSRDRES